MIVAAMKMATMKAPSHVRRLDPRLISTDARLRDWARWQVGASSGGVHLGYPHQWVTGKVAGRSGPAPTPKEPADVATTGSAVLKLDGQERKAIEAEYCNPWMDRDERFKLAGLGEREYRETLSRARWQMKALLGL